MKDFLDKPLVKSAFAQSHERHPVWFLRQAGRYLPEYRAIRQEMSFVDLCKSPENVAEVTLQPLRRFDLDAAIIFSDILILPTLLGQDLSFGKGHGPILEPVCRDMQSVKGLRVPDMERDIDFLQEGIRLTKAQLKAHQTMIGFAGAPFTVASYMIEGGGSKTFSEVKKMAFSEPKTFQYLLELIADATVLYLQKQVDAGAETLMLFDSWASHFCSQDYASLVYPVTNKMMMAISKMGVPLIYYPGQGSDNLHELHEVCADVIAVDWRVPLTRAAKTLSSIGVRKTLQGNLDPVVLSWGDEGFVRKRVRTILEELQTLDLPGHIFNVGHGVLPTTRPEAIEWAIDELRSFSGSR